jgi:hypothetical protein
LKILVKPTFKGSSWCAVKAIPGGNELQIHNVNMADANKVKTQGIAPLGIDLVGLCIISHENARLSRPTKNQDDKGNVFSHSFMPPMNMLFIPTSLLLLVPSLYSPYTERFAQRSDPKQ